MHLLSSQSPEDSVAMLAMMLLSWLLCGPRMMVMKSHKRFKKEQSSKSDSTSDDSEEMKKRKHWKHKHSGGKHLKKCHHHELHSLSENSNESGSDEDQRRHLQREGGHKHHKIIQVCVSSPTACPSLYSWQ
jgi:hypothetical protein